MFPIKSVNINACMDLKGGGRYVLLPAVGYTGSCMFQQAQNEYRCLSRINTVVWEHGSTIVRAETLLPSLALIVLKAQYLHAQSVLEVNETWCTRTGTGICYSTTTDIFSKELSNKYVSSFQWTDPIPPTPCIQIKAISFFFLIKRFQI